MKGRDGIREQAEALGFAWIHIPEQGRGVWRCRCSICNVASDHGWPFDTNPQKMVANMRRQGWRMGWKHGNQCPECIKTERKEKPVNEAPLNTLHQQPITNIGPDPKLARRIYQQLDDHFDEVTKRYKGSESDETIAKRISTSVMIVAKIREEAYGKLAADPEALKLQQAIDDMAKRYDDRMTAMMEQFDGEVRVLKQRQAKLLGDHKAAG